MDPLALINKASGPELIEAIVELARSNDLAALVCLEQFLKVREDHTLWKHEVPRLVCLALISKGPVGIKTLLNALPHAPGSIYPTAIIEAIWSAAHGRLPASTMLRTLPPPESLLAPLSQETIDAAVTALHALVLEAADNEDIFDPLINFIYLGNFFPEAANLKFKVLSRRKFFVFSQSREYASQLV